MRAWFERNVGGRAACTDAGRSQCHGLAMRPAADSSRATTNDLTAANDHAPDRRVRGRESQLRARQFERLTHETLVAHACH